MRYGRISCLLFCCFFLIQNAVAQRFEMRGVWVASVVNLDFPSKRDLPSAVQQAEFVQLLDQLQALGINAVFVQVRPSGDALYPTMAAPFSEWLVGEQGALPKPFYDPLQFMIAETHKRGMEFHAWFNPFRAVFNNKTKLSEDHIARLRPEWVVRYDAQRLFNPGIPEVRRWVVRSILEVVMRYEIDGVHLDDYFYPYPKAGIPDFDDQETFVQYGQLDYGRKDDWRRSNISNFIRELSEGIKAIKPFVKFGISPFGVWRNKADDPQGSNTRAGITTYDILYADVRLWLQKGWLDYVAPQLYFQVGHPLADYQTLLDWWTKNAFGRHVYIGQAIFKIEDWKSPQEMPDHLQRTRAQAQGDIFFRAKILLQNPLGFADSLQKDVAENGAPLTPPMPWIDDTPPPPPKFLETLAYSRGIRLTWQKNDPDVRSLLLYRAKKGESLRLHAQLNGDAVTFLDQEVTPKATYTYLLLCRDRLSNTSVPSPAVQVKYRKKYQKRKSQVQVLPQN